MFVFIDESGTNKGSGHSVFALVYIAVKNYEIFDSAVSEIEKKLKIDSFHWAKSALPVREKFLEGLAKLDFKAKVAIVRNPSLPDNEMERLLPHMLIERNIHSIILDGEKPKWYQKKLKKILRDRGVTTKKLKMENDRSSAGIRAADAIAGLTRAYYAGKGGSVVQERFEQLRRKKIVLILE